MSGRIDLAPGVEIAWASPEDGSAPLEKDAFLHTLELAGGQPCWRPHFPGDFMKILSDEEQKVFLNGEEVPEKKIPDVGYDLFEITFPSLSELEYEFNTR
jgi:hypothetical protein